MTMLADEVAMFNAPADEYLLPDYSSSNATLPGNEEYNHMQSAAFSELMKTIAFVIVIDEKHHR